MVNKNLTLQRQRAGALRHREAMKRYKGPYDCPKCFAVKSITVEKLKKGDKTNTWFVKCSSCGIWEKIELPVIYQKIDVINYTSDIFRRKE